MSKLLKHLVDNPMGNRAYISSIALLALSLLCAMALTLVLMLVYRMCHDSLTYNRKFNVTLMMLTLASTVLLALVQNSPKLSLGVLGALSICRIRTNTRDPRDLGFVFWALSIGISCALGAFAVGAVGTLVMSCTMLLIGRPRTKKDVVTMIVRGQKDQIGPVQEIFSHTPGSEIQSKNVFEDSFEVVYNLSIPQEAEENLVVTFNNMDGIQGVNVLAPETQVA